MNQPTREVPIIQMETDLSRFNTSELNRAVRRNRVEELVTSILDKGDFLHLFPIIISSTGIVVDGQHRLAAARRLLLPIYYIVSDDLDVEQVARFNEATTSWRTVDYLYHWARRGFPDYVEALDYFEKHAPYLLISVLIYIGGESSTSAGYSAFRKGEWHFVHKEALGKVMSTVREIRGTFPYAVHRSFVLAVFRASQNENVDLDKLVTKVRQYSNLMQRRASTEEYLTMLETVYNAGESNPRSLVRFFM